MPPTPQGTVAPQARPLHLLSRVELGDRWAAALAQARAEGALRSSRGAAAWLSLPAITELLGEFRRREMARVAEIAFWGEVLDGSVRGCWVDDVVVTFDN